MPRTLKAKYNKLIKEDNYYLSPPLLNIPTVPIMGVDIKRESKRFSVWDRSDGLWYSYAETLQEAFEDWCHCHGI
jgi:hypothetical protein